MKMFNKIWDILSTLIVLYGMGVVIYIAILNPDPTNEELADCILYSMCIILWHINNVVRKIESK